MFWKVYLNVFFGFGIVISSPQKYDDVSGEYVARNVLRFGPLVAPCIRNEGLVWLHTSAGVLLRDAGFSRRIWVRYVILT